MEPITYNLQHDRNATCDYLESKVRYTFPAYKTPGYIGSASHKENMT